MRPSFSRDHSAQFTRLAALHTISRRFEHTCAISLDTQQRQALFAQCFAFARVADIFTLLARNHTARVFKAHIRNSPAPLRITLYYNSSLFSVAFLLFLFLFGRSCGRQNLSYSSIYRNTSFFARTPPDNPFACRPHTLHRSAARRHPASARFSRPVRAPSAKSAAAFAAELPFDAPSCLFRLPLFPQAVQGSAFLCVLVSCGTHVLSFTKTSTFIEVFARLCIFIHCVIACFSPMRLLFPSLRSFPRCRSAADDRVSALLRRFCFRAPHRRPACRFRRRSFAFRFSAVVPPSFFDFLISFCLMLHGAPQPFCLFFSASGFSRFPFEDPLRIFARFLIRLHLNRSPLPNLSILLDTVSLLLYNYLAFACESPLFVSFLLYKATRSDRPSAVRSVEQRHKTTTK